MDDVTKVIDVVEDAITTPTRLSKIRAGFSVGRLIVGVIDNIVMRVRARRQRRNSKMEIRDDL